ncbi:hypothetical protein QN277_011740 [Acacia crassicarpa]|uniref:Transposase MuDR plant domain-containing protein n=1 Tax=Acacia crassicarpa TaxID=499986 RepID=A0AAE1MZ16_9FABA|nr:hypothetical protein QN277_011740 [Acacia crassicarpa]
MALEGSSGRKGSREGRTDELSDRDVNRGDELFEELRHYNGDNPLIPSEGEDEGEGEDKEDSDANSDGDDEEDPDFDNGMPSFRLEETFANKKELVSAIDNYAVRVGVKLKIVRSEPSRVLIRCQTGYPFVLYASKDGPHPGLKIKSLLLEHSCSRVFKNPRASVKFLAEYFKYKLRDRPNYRVKDMKKDAEEELMVSVSLFKCKRARRLIVEGMEGSYIDEFNHLESYCNESKRSNPVFSRLYVCFNAAKQTGWKAGCRPIIGLDGTFLKGNA